MSIIFTGGDVERSIANGQLDPFLVAEGHRVSVTSGWVGGGSRCI